MGGSESKPEFPSEAEWRAWQRERDAKLQKMSEEAMKAQKAQITTDTLKTISLFEKYMQECHDKSRLKRWLFDNSECTIARNDLIYHLGQTVTNVVQQDTLMREAYRMRYGK